MGIRLWETLGRLLGHKDVRKSLGEVYELWDAWPDKPDSLSSGFVAGLDLASMDSTWIANLTNKTTPPSREVPVAIDPDDYGKLADLLTKHNTGH